ncbi:hypothetical protein E8E13_007262 [Curvularia kusanoi]|uniref:PLAC8-domain-containing protein n=1 Tax=Curvularia kusanoi TaxID=90978 RepID=A0A9P4W9M6_CURKU|nr:hypothetical protein E8E13_007262 [Curvularia kusanoi]
MEHNNDLSSYSCCNTSCAGFTALTCVGFAWILPLMNRGDIRNKYSLTGNGCKDCLCACCCAPCDLVQQDKEVKHREEQGKPLLDQPGRADGMNYKPQWERVHGQGGQGQYH